MKTCILVLEDIRSVENTGSIFRTAEGLGVKKIYLVGTTPAPVDRFGRERKDFAKVSLGSEKMLEWQYSKDIESVISELHSQRFQIIALEQDCNTNFVGTFDPKDRFALIVGNEVGGVSKNTLSKCDEVVEIPMKGKKESLNVSVAAGIALFELLK